MTRSDVPARAIDRSGLRRAGRVRAAARRAFSLVELIVVIGIITVLVTLVLAIGSIVLLQSEVRQTAATMEIVDAAILEWEQQMQRPLVFQGIPGEAWAEVAGGSYDVAYNPRFRDDDGGLINCPGTVYVPNVNPLKWTAATLEVLQQNPDCRDMLARADDALVRSASCVVGTVERTLNITEFRDPWETQVLIVFPGRAWRETDTDLVRDSDGTVRTSIEEEFGICRNRRPLLVSAGPDLEFGDRADGASALQRERTADNVYSYEPEDV